MIDWTKYPNFSESEFVCPCCGRVDMAEILIQRLQGARYLANIGFTINSGFRCERHNTEVGGRKNSAHLKGLAADIHCVTSANRYKMVVSLLKAGFTRIEIRTTWIHADCDIVLPQDVIFLN